MRSQARQRLGAAGVVVVIALALAVATDAPGSAAPGWGNSETLDLGNSTGTDTATVYYPTFEQHHIFNQGQESGQSVLRHGWFQPGFSSWAFKTLDVGNSIGRANTTVYYPTFEQHHVFNQGQESGEPVLRHGWFQPGFSSWAFETLDAGVSTGTDTATVAFGDQHHLFTHGLEADQDVLRHGVFDPAVGAWQFQTLDVGQSVGRWLSAMVSETWGPQLHVFGSGPPTWPPGTFDYPEGSLRHGWYSAAEGWQFETLLNGELDSSGREVPGIGGRTVSWAGAEGNQNVAFALPFANCSNEEDCSGLQHLWYDGSGWHADAPGFGCDSRGIICFTSASGKYPAAAINPVNDNLELFNKGNSGIALSHLFWDGTSWIAGSLDGVQSSGRHNSATAYPIYNQVHVFTQGVDGSSLRHIWWEPA